MTDVGNGERDFFGSHSDPNRRSGRDPFWSTFEEYLGEREAEG